MFLITGSTGRMLSAYCSLSYICASTENLAGHDFVSVNIRPCLYFLYLFLVHDKVRISKNKFYKAQLFPWVTGNAHMPRQGRH